jgi:hypothetical protein
VDRFDDNASASACTVAANDCSLRGAISQANADGQMTTIVLPDGTYTLTVYGGGEDLNATGDLDILAELEITAAPGARPVIDQTTRDRIFHTFPGVGGLTIVGPMTLENSASGNTPGVLGGGLILANGSESLTLEDVDLTGGQAPGSGGCLSFTNPVVPGTLSLTNVTISGCSTADNGGGLFAEIGDSTATFHRVVIENNTADQIGGGIALSSSSTWVLFTESTIRGNVAGFGGGLHSLNAKVTLERSTVAGNRAGAATASFAYGGGLDLRNSAALIQNSTVSGNVVQGTACLGSAIHVDSASGSSTLLVEQSTISGDPTSSLTHFGVGISSNGTITFQGSIVEGGCTIANTGTFVSDGFNVERPIDGSVTTQCGLTDPSDVLTSSPLLKPLAGYGGPTATHALLPGTPAAWLVSSTYCQATDQRMAPRGLLFCDAGSYESGAEAPGMWIFSDGYESGDVAAWSSAVP